LQAHLAPGAGAAPHFTLSTARRAATAGGQAASQEQRQDAQQFTAHFPPSGYEHHDTTGLRTGSMDGVFVGDRHQLIFGLKAMGVLFQPILGGCTDRW